MSPASGANLGWEEMRMVMMTRVSVLSHALAYAVNAPIKQVLQKLCVLGLLTV